LAAIAAVNFLGVGLDEAIKILGEFHGAERRLQIKGVKDDVLVIDDYAHHHTEIKATLNAVKNIYPDKKIILAFQPHRYTRTAIFLEQLAKSLSMADKIFLLPVFEASEDYIKHGTSDSLAEEINKIKDCVLCNNFDEALKLIKLEVKAGDILLTMGAGTIYILGEKFLES
ncbi:MAG: UDP-N-acetylmuramate--L-alanine ligase, partial [Synergistaceae bacterium]|nr:UDP-N-acetylmuramate--L-alanine ligase [Synergistaceae bacterium]